MSSRAFTIREMEIQDLPSVYELGAQTFRAGLWQVLYRNWDEYEVTSLFNTDGEFCLVAEADEDESLCGFALGAVSTKPRSAWSYGYVLWLCAHPAWRRERVATKLVDELVARMVEEGGARIVIADTDPNNEPAVRFFTEMGFAEQTPHVYLTSNLANNPRYQGLLNAAKADARKGPTRKATEAKDRRPRATRKAKATHKRRSGE